VCFPRSGSENHRRTSSAASGPGSRSSAKAWVVVHDRSAHRLHDGVVSLDRQELTCWTARPAAGPLLLEEYDEATELIKKDPSWQAAIRRRGVEDLEQVRVDAWMIGNFGIAEHEGAGCAHRFPT